VPVRRPTRRRGALAAALLAAWALPGCAGAPASGPADCAAPPDPAALAASASVEPPSGAATRGAALFERECQRCHSPRRQDRESRFFRGYPRLDCADYLSTAPPGYLFTAIAEGGPAVGRSEAMKPFAEVLSQQQIADLVTFLRRGH